MRVAGGDAVSAQVVIVTGSRALADDPAATRWARDILTRELASATLVVAGDARGPDAWAHEIAAGFVAPIDCERWCVNGLREAHLGSVRTTWYQLTPWSTPETPRDPRLRPLARNAAMVMFFTRAARMVALYSPAATTRGTAHTVGLARAAGIDVTEYVWGMS